MSDNIVLNNYSDDSRIKQYIRQNLMTRVFHDIPMNVLNTGAFSIISEYISQATEQLAFTSTFYFNESFITKAILPDSIYAEAAIFDLGYGFATPSATEILLELRLEELFNNATYNPETGLKEFILDKDTQFNLSNGNVYSLDYDILFQYMDVGTATRSANTPAWNVQYINMENGNCVAINKNRYIVYRVTETWICLFVKVSEYKRTKYIITNNMTSGIPNEDYLITLDDHICGFDITYIDTKGNRTPLRQDHILPIHGDVKDLDPYVHYIMDNPNTIRIMFQMAGNRYFVPALNSQFEITVYTCHGMAANFTEAPKEQPSVITATSIYPNNANVMKTAFVIGASLGGSNIGNAELVRRQTIEAYNTANVISTDHDIDEWFKTFYFKNIIYPFFFKRRDDPWGRIWSGYLALKDDEDNVYRTNTLHGKIPYQVLYNNNDNTVSNNEVIIPPGWTWVYGNENRYTVIPYTQGNGKTVETPKTLYLSYNESQDTHITRVGIGNHRYVFANPFGIRIQKSPFAIGYFNPWINTTVIPTRMETPQRYSDTDISIIYHASPIYVEITRTYKKNYYHIQTYVDTSQLTTVDGKPWVTCLLQNATPPSINDILWAYFQMPTDLYATSIPMMIKTTNDGYLSFDPSKTYLCVEKRNQRDDGTIQLSHVWIQDNTDPDNPQQIDLPISNFDYLYGLSDVWGENGIAESITIAGDTDILCHGITNDDFVEFVRIGTFDYYTLKLKNDLHYTNEQGEQQPIVIKSVQVTVGRAVKTERHKFGEQSIYNVNEKYHNVVLNIRYEYVFVEYGYDADGNLTQITGDVGGVLDRNYTISNAVDVCLPYATDKQPTKENDLVTFVYPETQDVSTQQLYPGTIIGYATMRPASSTNTISYYRIPFANLNANIPMFHIATSSMPLHKNKLRLLLHAYINGIETGRIEMLPVNRESDGTYLFQADLYPMNELVDVDNLIHIRSLEYGGGSWKPAKSGTVVNVDATNPEFRISVLFESTTEPTHVSEIDGDSTYTGYLVNDVYAVKDFSLVQELKEMRSVVNFDESSIPTETQMLWYQTMMDWFNSHDDGTYSLYDIYTMAYHQILEKVNLSETEKEKLSTIASSVKDGLKHTIAELIQVDQVLTDHDITTLTDGMNIIYHILDLLQQKNYTESFSYHDDNVQVCYVKEVIVRDESDDSDHTKPIYNPYAIYINFIKDHPESEYMDEEHQVNTYDINLSHDFLIQYPYTAYQANSSVFRIEGILNGSSFTEHDVVSEPLYQMGVLKNLQYVITLMEQGAIDLRDTFTTDDEKENTEGTVITEKDYSTLYVDEDCTTVLDPEEDILYVVKEENSLDSLFVYDGTKLNKKEDQIIWENIYDLIKQYQRLINKVFQSTNVNGGMEVQLMPFVEYSLMNSDKFQDFVKTFTQVHKAIEPVIFKRLEGNNYLDCKLIATYGLPHSYCADKQYYLDGEFWPDLRVQIAFDVKLYNRALAVNTLNELRTLVKAYFNRLTTVHTPAKLVSMNHNIYVSHLIRQLESHDNVAYMKFKGWYTNEKNTPNGNYMNAETQAIVMRWRTLEDMPTDELERFVPEMFVLDDKDIEINVIDDNILI